MVHVILSYPPGGDPAWDQGHIGPKQTQALTHPVPPTLDHVETLAHIQHTQNFHSDITQKCNTT